jgi:peptidyl-prolyl cis-trans isomerase D
MRLSRFAASADPIKNEGEFPAMLDVFRRHATSWLIKVFFGVIVIVFVFWGGYSYREGGGTEVARVGDQVISVAEYDRTYNQLLEMYRRQFGGAISEEMLKQFNLRKQALDSLIDQHVVGRAARELGLGASDQEVQQRILEFAAFQTEGAFDRQRYNALLQQNRLTPETFERQVSEEIGREKVEEFVKRRAVVTEEEILADFRFTHQRIQLSCVSFDPKQVEGQVVVEESKLRAYHEQHQQKYRDPEKRQFSYVKFRLDEHLGQVSVSDEEIRQYYEENPDKYHQDAEVRARHILFSVREDAPDDEVAKAKSEAEKVLAEARKGADFAALAGKHSKDEGTAGNGGDLGFFGRERMVQPFSEAAFSMKPGEISDLVRSPYGFHIIKVEDVRPESTRTLDQVRVEIEAALKEEKGRDVAFRKVTDFSDVVYAQQDLDKTSKSMQREIVNIEAWFTANDRIPDLEGAPPDIMGKLFTLPEKALSDVIEVSDGFVLVQVRAVQAERTLPFESVKDRVEKDFREEEGRKLAQGKAAELLESARKSGSLAEVAASGKLEIRKTDFFSRRQPDKDLKLRGDGLSRVFRLQASQPFPEEPLTDISSRFVVCQLMGRLDPDADIEKERPMIVKRLLAQKENLAWRNWLDERRKQANIKIVKEL